MSDFNSSLPVRTESAGDIDIFISDSLTPAQKLKVNADGSLDINTLQGSVVTVNDGTDTLEIESDGSITTRVVDEAGVAFSSANPLPVEFFENDEELYDYSTAAAVAADATSNHDYVTTGAFKLKEAMISGSGRVKAELQIETGVAAGTYNTVGVKFSSAANPNMDFKFQKGINVASGVTVRIIRTNLDKQAQDLYSTVVGINV